MTTAHPYIVNCAGCKARRAFKSTDRLAAWTQNHRCWEKANEQPVRGRVTTDRGVMRFNG